jgi:hypothetical protein
MDRRGREPTTGAGIRTHGLTDVAQATLARVLATMRGVSTEIAARFSMMSAGVGSRNGTGLPPSASSEGDPNAAIIMWSSEKPLVRFISRRAISLPWSLLSRRTSTTAPPSIAKGTSRSWTSRLTAPSPLRVAVAPSLRASSIAVRAHFLDVWGGLRAAGWAAITLWQPWQAARMHPRDSVPHVNPRHSDLS